MACKTKTSPSRAQRTLKQQNSKKARWAKDRFLTVEPKTRSPKKIVQVTGRTGFVEWEFGGFAFLGRLGAKGDATKLETPKRPSLGQIVAFGAAGGMIPCPASITVMLLALSIGKFASGLLAVVGFSMGLAITLVGIGLIVVAGISRIHNTGRFHRISSQAPVLSAVVVILSGLATLVFTH